MKKSLLKYRFFPLLSILFLILVILEVGKNQESKLLPIPIAKAQESRLQYYGVDQAQPHEFEWLSQQGINLVMIGLSGGGGGQSYYEAARANGIKLGVWPLGGGEENTPWYWNGGNNWNISEGHTLLNELVDNHAVIWTVQSLHEAYWRGGQGAIPSESQKVLADMLRDYTRNRGHEIEVYNYIDQVAAWSTWPGVNDPVVEDQQDWAAIWRHVMCGRDDACDSSCVGGEGTCAQAKQLIRDDRAYIDSRGWDMKLAFAVQAFGYNALGVKMPTYQELKRFTCDIIAENNLEALWYYSWRRPFGYDIVLHDYHELEVPESPTGYYTGIIKDVYDDCIQGLPPSFDPCQADLNQDGIVNTPDMEILLNSWLLSGPGDLNLDSKINCLDFSIIISLWGQSCTSSPSP